MERSTIRQTSHRSGGKTRFMCNWNAWMDVVHLTCFFILVILPVAVRFSVVSVMVTGRTSVAVEEDIHTPASTNVLCSFSPVR